MPTAIGTSSSATIVRISNALTVGAVGSPVIARLNSVAGPASVRPANTAAAANHFSCCRATPVDLRTRRTSDAADSTTAIASRTKPSDATAWMIGAVEDETPSGLSRDRDVVDRAGEQGHRRGRDSDRRSRQPRHGLPAGRQELAVGKHQHQERRRQPGERNPDPGGKPACREREWDGAGRDGQAVDGVLGAEPDGGGPKADRDEERANPVAGHAERDEGPHTAEGDGQDGGSAPETPGVLEGCVRCSKDQDGHAGDEAEGRNEGGDGERGAHGSVLGGAGERPVLDADGRHGDPAEEALQRPPLAGRPRPSPRKASR